MEGSNEGRVEAALRASWCLETCDDSDRHFWSADNPVRGQCGATALVVHDLLGGDLLVADVFYADGARQGHHWWNRLPDGRELDLTREQFGPGELVQAPRLVQRPPGLPRRGARQYVLLKHRVARHLGAVAAV